MKRHFRDAIGYQGKTVAISNVLLEGALTVAPWRTREKRAFTRDFVGVCLFVEDLVSAEGIESANKRNSNNIQSDR